MESRIQKWGNSLAVRIPKPFASEVGLHQDDEVELHVKQGKLVITPMKIPAFRLADLLAEICPSNLHDEVDPGAAVGHEVW